MIAIKVFIQSLGVVAVGGGVVGGTAYKINNDIQLKKTTQTNKTNAISIEKDLEALQKELTEIKEKIKSEEKALSTSVIAFEKDIQELEKTIVEINGKLVLIKAKIVTQQKTIDSGKGKEQKLKEATQNASAKEALVKEAQSKLDIAISTLTNLTSAKEIASENVKTAESKKTENESSVSSIKEKIAAQEKAKSLAQEALNTENAKSNKPECAINPLPSLPRTEGQEGQIPQEGQQQLSQDQQSCPTETDSQYKNNETVTNLTTKLTDETQKLSEITLLLSPAELLVINSLSDITTKKGIEVTALDAFTKANKAKTDANEIVTNLTRELNTLKALETNAKNAFEALKVSYESTKSELPQTQEKLKTKEAEKITKNSELQKAKQSKPLEEEKQKALIKKINTFKEKEENLKLLFAKKLEEQVKLKKELFLLSIAK